MNKNKLVQIESLLGRQLSDIEINRLEKIQGVLKISDDDALWDVIIALEYHREYYVKLPDEIEKKTSQILLSLQESAKTAVEKQAQHTVLMADKSELFGKILLIILAALISGAFLMWAGFCLGNGQTHPPAFLLRMPVGFVFAGLSLGFGIYLTCGAGRDFAEKRKGWPKILARAAFAYVLPGLIVWSMT